LIAHHAAVAAPAKGSVIGAGGNRQPYSRGNPGGIDFDFSSFLISTWVVAFSILVCGSQGAFAVLPNSGWPVRLVALTRCTKAWHVIGIIAAASICSDGFADAVPLERSRNPRRARLRHGRSFHDRLRNTSVDRSMDVLPRADGSWLRRRGNPLRVAFDRLHQYSSPGSKAQSSLGSRPLFLQRAAEVFLVFVLLAALSVFSRRATSTSLQWSDRGASVTVLEDRLGLGTSLWP